MIQTKTALDQYYMKLAESVEESNTNNSSIKFPLIENDIITVPAEDVNLISNSEIVVSEKQEFLPDEIDDADNYNEYGVITNKYRYYLSPVEFTYNVRFQKNTGIISAERINDVVANIKTTVPYSNKEMFKKEAVNYAIKNGIITQQYSVRSGTAKLISVDCIVIKEKYFD